MKFGLFEDIYQTNKAVADELPEEKRVFTLDIAAVITSLNIILPVLFLSYSIISFFASELYTLSYLSIVCFTFSIFISFVFRFLKSYFQIVNTILCMIYFNILTVMYHTGGTESSIIFWLAIIPISSFIFLDKKSTILWTFIFLASISSFAIFSDYINQHALPVVEFNSALMLIQTVIIAFTLLLYFYIFLSS